MAARVQAGAPRGVHPSIPRPLHTRWEPTPPLSCVVACTLLAGRLVGMTTHYVLMACCAGLRCRTRGTRTTRSGAAGTSPTKAWLGWASRQTSVAGALGGGIFVLFFASAGQAPAEQAPRAGVPLQVKVKVKVKVGKSLHRLNFPVLTSSFRPLFDLPDAPSAVPPTSSEWVPGRPVPKPWRF